ncbi:RNA polymerase sigma factor, RpoD/SigA family [Cyanobacterium sp. IPPAS B-1200]|uniref:RNA polymerase sigma factor, RpoD/SigA family n=1 Tax=Cyanobacterium sp. IPPAS B-1200 TaxID=1562720 RepID=UPI0008526267|nr:RNA polymerase sigma factor, RpoD/SigA family [Cyanobacterium sp. IPPAS B-1200]OEJ79287.1 RNA polymerase subunit sigma [Cyanobacterium sp. IPPAS B-1200]
MSKFYFRPENVRASSFEELSSVSPSSSGKLPTVTFSEKNQSVHRPPNSKDSVRLYLRDIGRIPLLTKEQEIDLARKVCSSKKLIDLRDKHKEEDKIKDYINAFECYESLSKQLLRLPSMDEWCAELDLTSLQLKQVLQNGIERWAELAKLETTELEEILSMGKGAKQHMINANLRLVVSIAKKYQNRGLDLLDLIQEGTLGLEKAVEKFDYRKGYHFSTYAYWWIRQGMTRAIATQSRSIRIPIHITEKLNLLKKTQRQLSQTLGRTPKAEELAEKMEMTAFELRNFLSQIPRSISLETKVGEDYNTELVELIETDSATPEENLMLISMRQDVNTLLSSLSEREAKILRLRYGFEDGKTYSLSDTAEMMHLSRERVRQIQAKAIQKLRQPNTRQQLHDYLEIIS